MTTIPEPNPRGNTCADCKKPIQWAISSSGIHLPMNPPNPAKKLSATLAYHKTPDGLMFRALVARETPQPDELFTTSHWATCSGRAPRNR